MELPSKKECIALMEEYRLPANVIKHSLAVNRISVLLAKKLKNSGININPELVDRASLLHDLDKIITLKNSKHGFETEKILKGKGYPELGKSAKKHRFSFIGKLGSWEEKIINYADKRCIESRIVSLKERFAYLRKRYKHAGNETEKREKAYYQLEKEIFGRIGIKPMNLFFCKRKVSSKENCYKKLHKKKT